jgi:hypothetical protein
MHLGVDEQPAGPAHTPTTLLSTKSLWWIGTPSATTTIRARRAATVQIAVLGGLPVDHDATV